MGRLTTNWKEGKMEFTTEIQALLDAGLITELQASIAVDKVTGGQA